MYQDDRVRVGGCGSAVPVVGSGRGGGRVAVGRGSAPRAAAGAVAVTTGAVELAWAARATSAGPPTGSTPARSPAATVARGLRCSGVAAQGRGGIYNGFLRSGSGSGAADPRRRSFEGPRWRPDGSAQPAHATDRNDHWWPASGTGCGPRGRGPDRLPGVGAGPVSPLPGPADHSPTGTAAGGAGPPRARPPAESGSRALPGRTPRASSRCARRSPAEGQSRHCAGRRPAGAAPHAPGPSRTGPPTPEGRPTHRSR